MTIISAQSVKELRERTGAGMLDCKKALTENNNDMESAIDWLRTKGLAAAAKKADRTAAEGLVGVVTSGTKGAVLEVNAETDFVARNEKFQHYVKTATGIALTSGASIDDLGAIRYDGDRTVQGELTELISVIGENMGLRRSTVLSVSDGVVAGYTHGAIAPGLGRIGVLVALESTGDKAVLETVGKQIAMHAAASSPQFLNTAAVDADSLDRERRIFSEQARASGKPEEFIGKMIEGRVRKYYEEVCLLEQIYLIDTSKRKIADVVADVAKELGTSVSLTGFALFKLGDGIEKDVTDFAAEVAQQLGQSS